MGLETSYHSLRSLSRWVQLSLVASLLQIFFICTLEAIVFRGVLSDRQVIKTLIDELPRLPTATKNSTQFMHLDKVDRSRSYHDALPVYFGLFFFAQIFQFVLCCDAARNQNTIQILVLAFFNFLLLLYACVQLSQNYKANSFFSEVAKYYNLSFEISTDNIPLEISIIIILILFATSFAYIAYKLYQEYGWNIYKRIGADLQMRRRFTIYHIFVMVMKFDILLFISFSTQYIFLVIYPFSGFGQMFFIHLILSILICIVMSILAFWSVKTENNKGIILFALGCFGVMCYFISKLVAIHIPCTPPICVDRFASSRIFLTVFTCLCIFFSISTIIGSLLCYKNFGKGLKNLSKSMIFSFC
ncbi:hypothetical protein DSO57_1004802 [Entomophthora muscae]|uniref:Uncharacterized protein n=1 Tax=Entomophthora muscae TaxID=34485 RepID=A0ACC2RMR6_9FUNG|nr:hypothetical protein DSO57_1004802 [Entomophthora muscae]